MSDLPPEQNSILPRETAESLLQPHFSALLDIINGGWEAWEELGTLAPHLRVPLTSRCRASFVYEHICYAAKAHFAGKHGVRIEEKRGFLLVHLNNSLTIRFKKLDKNLRTSNIKTRQQELFSLQMDIQGMPKSTRLVTGYKLNELQTAIEQVAVTCPNGNKLEWVIEIPDAPGNISFMTPEVAPIEPATIVAKNVKRIAKQNTDE